MDISERIRQLRGDLTREQFSKATGIPPQTLYKYESRTGKVSLESVEAICKSLNLCCEWLVFGRGPKHYTEETNPKVSRKDPSDTEMVHIPLIDSARFTAHGNLETSDHMECNYAFRRDFIASKGNPGNMVLIRASGDSMAPEIQHNDIVLIDQCKKAIVPGYLFAVGFEQSIYLKRIDNLPGKIILKSVNSDYPPVELDVHAQNEEQFCIVGRVLWSGREYN